MNPKPPTEAERQLAAELAAAREEMDAAYDRALRSDLIPGNTRMTNDVRIAHVNARERPSEKALREVRETTILLDRYTTATAQAKGHANYAGTWKVAAPVPEPPPLSPEEQAVKAEREAAERDAAHG